VVIVAVVMWSAIVQQHCLPSEVTAGHPPAAVNDKKPGHLSVSPTFA